VEDKRIGRRYARALYDVAKKYNVVAAVESDLNAIIGAIDRDPTFKAFLLAPYSSREEKTEILDRLFSDRVTALTMQIIRVMLEKRREHDIPSVQEEFVAIRREEEGIVVATVSSAAELSAAERKALVAKLNKSLGKTVEAEYVVDPRLIGGVKVAFGTYVLDGTIRGALEQLREKLRHDLLKQA
jgi:F-type H+-transporting ATPase subunit delta